MTSVFLKIVNMSISAGWIVLAVLFLRLLLKKAPKWINVLLWGIVAVRLVCPFSIESVLSLIPSAETVSPEIMTDQYPEINSGVPMINHVVNPVIGETLTPDVTASANPLQIIIPILTAVWLTGMAAMLVYTVISVWRVKRRVGTAVLLRENIYQSENVVSPFVLGVISPKIYLPFAVNGQDMEHVVAHEKAHISRKDHWFKPLGFLLLSVHWFNPLVWLGYVLLCRDIELACDEKVVKNFTNEQKADYSEALLTCSVNRRMIAACPIAFGEVGVKARVKSVLNYKKPAFWVVVVAVVLSIVTAVCFLTNPRTTLNDELSVFIDGQISEHHYKEGRTDGNFIVISHKVLGVDGSFDKTTVYMWVMYKEYGFENGHITEETASHIPTVITVKRTGKHRHYKLVEYWTPRDGSYYADDVREKFPLNLRSKALDPQRYVKAQESFCRKAAEDYYKDWLERFNWTWTYSPSLSHTSHYTKGFKLQLDYTHVEASCTNGEMWNLEADGQPRGTKLQFEEGNTVYWAPNDLAISEIGQRSEVSLVIYKDKTQTYRCEIVFECVEKTDGTAKFEIYLSKTDGLEMLSDGVITPSKVGQSTINGGNTNPYLPKLYVVCGGHRTTAITGTASWSFKTEDGKGQTINADSSDIWESIEYIEPWAINVADRGENSRLTLDFSVVPDSIKVNAWFFSKNGNIKPFDAEVDGLEIILNASTEPSIYEVVAKWNESDDKEHSGMIHYAFCVTSYQTNDLTVKEIVDKTATELIFTEDAVEPFYVDENYVYYFPSIKSQYVLVRFTNGKETTVKHALSQGLISIGELDRWGIKYTKEEKIGEWGLDDNGGLKWVLKYPHDIYRPTSGHLQTLYEPTPTEEIEVNIQNGEFVITKMHYLNTEQKWWADGYTYKYRLEITGRMNNAVKNSTYIVLSNTKDITFEQAWKADGYSSLSTDYFDPKTAGIVGKRSFS